MKRHEFRKLFKSVGPAVLPVIHVTDGDSLRVRPADGGDPVTVRLEGIDAPELDQTCEDTNRQSWPCGRAALRALLKHCDQLAVGGLPQVPAQHSREQ